MDFDLLWACKPLTIGCTATISPLLRSYKIARERGRYAVMGDLWIHCSKDVPSSQQSFYPAVFA